MEMTEKISVELDIRYLNPDYLVAEVIKQLRDSGKLCELIGFDRSNIPVLSVDGETFLLSPTLSSSEITSAPGMQRFSLLKSSADSVINSDYLNERARRIYKIL